jgi:phytoene dehydrogenase-like protein
MTERRTYDDGVVGAGPNGLAAAVELARNGRSVAVLEAEDTVGGGARSAELTLPGFVHDLGSAIHPIGYVSPFFRSLPLENHGPRWIHPPVPLAHPFDDGTAAMLERSTQATGATLGPDAEAYRETMDPLVEDARRIVATLTGSPRAPRHPLALAAAVLRSLRSARGVAGDVFRGERAKGLFGGNATHSFLPLEKGPSALFGLLLGTLGHAFGWPFPEGGSQKIADALVSYLVSLRGEVYTGVRVEDVREVPRTRAVLFDVTPRQLLGIAGRHFSERYREDLERYRYGPGVFKVDFALSGPIPWKTKECLRAGTVHLGGTMDDIASGEAAVSRGEHPERPWVLLVQQSLFDESRAPDNKHTVWAYCHVPNGSEVDMTERIEAQIERFAPASKRAYSRKASPGRPSSRARTPTSWAAT